jgi:hypothetical protein
MEDTETLKEICMAKNIAMVIQGYYLLISYSPSREYATKLLDIWFCNTHWMKTKYEDLAFFMKSDTKRFANIEQGHNFH